MTSLISAVLGLSVGALILWLVRKDKLVVRDGITWVAVAVCFVTVGIFPELIDSAAAPLGISYPPTLAIIISLCALTLKVLLSDISQARTEIRVIRLSQELAILRLEVSREKA